MNKNIEATSADLPSLVQKAAAGHADFVQANRERGAAEMGLLRVLIDTIKPALPAIVGPFYHRVTYVGPKTEDKPLQGEQFEEPGVLLFDNVKRTHSSREHLAPGTRAGSFVGGRLYLLESGEFWLTDGGHWSETDDGWEESEFGQGGIRLSSVEGLNLFDWVDVSVEDITQVIHRLLDAQVNGKKSKRTAQLKTEAERFRAVATLLHK